MKSGSDRIARLHNDLTDKIGIQPKLADGISNAVRETVLLVYDGIEASEMRLKREFEVHARKVEKWHYEDQRQIQEHLTAFRKMESDIHRKIMQDFVRSDEAWWRTIVSALVGSAVSIVLISFIVGLVKGLS